MAKKAFTVHFFLYVIEFSFMEKRFSAFYFSINSDIVNSNFCFKLIFQNLLMSLILLLSFKKLNLQITIFERLNIIEQSLKKKLIV